MLHFRKKKYGIFTSLSSNGRDSGSRKPNSSLCNQRPSLDDRKTPPSLFQPKSSTTMVVKQPSASAQASSWTEKKSLYFIFLEPGLENVCHP